MHGTDLVVVPEPVVTTNEFPADLALTQASVGGRRVTLRVVPSEADVSRELVDLSYETDNDLLVADLRHCSPVGKLIMGSLTQQMLLGARYPVTAVKPPVTTGEE